jgi:hypothetical protein
MNGGVAISKSTAETPHKPSTKSLQQITSEKERIVGNMEQLDCLEDRRYKQKELCEYFKTTFENWESEFTKIPRHGQGVANVRKLKELCTNVKIAMGPKGEFSRNFSEISNENVPGFQKCGARIEKFKELLDDKTPSPVTLENIREITGEIIGNLEAFLRILYHES